MKALLALGLTICFALTSWAGSEPEFPEEGEIVADLVCGDSGGAVHINTVTEQMWQGELDSKTGIILDVTEFTHMRCPDCYDISAKLEVWGQVVYYKVQVRREPAKSKNKEKIVSTLTISGQGDTPDEIEEDTFEWTCRRK